MRFVTALLSTLLYVFTPVIASESTVRAIPDLEATSLTEIGFPSGYSFEGLQTNHEKSFHFYVPRTALAGGGELVLYYEISSGLEEKSMLRVDVNGTPRLSRKLSADATEARLVIPLSEKELTQSPYLELTLRASLLVTGDFCLDARLGTTHYFHLLPQSSLHLKLKSHAGNLNDAWDSLPKEVTISIPETLSEYGFGNALLLASQMMENGKRVRFVNLPSLGDMVLADVAAIEQVIQDKYLANEQLIEQYGVDSIPVPQDKNIFLLNLPDRQLIAISESFQASPAELMAGSWKTLSYGTAYDLGAIKEQQRLAMGNDKYAIPLETLGLDLKTRYILDKSIWSLPLGNERFGADRVPEALNLEVISSPSDSDTPTLIQVFMNGLLQQVASLPNDGKPHNVTIHLGAHDIKPDYNAISIHAQRVPSANGCKGVPPTYPIQITTNSYLVVSRQVNSPQQFRDLAAWFANGVDLYVPQQSGQALGSSLGFLANLISSNQYPLDVERIQFYGSDAGIAPDKPFIALGDAPLDINASGVHFDKGRIRVVSGRGEVLLDLDGMPGITIAQLASAGSSSGLWILPKGDIAQQKPQKMQLANDSVAFFKDGELLLSLDPEQQQLVTVEYPEHKQWFDHLGRYKFWLWALVWLLFTVFVVHLYSKSRQHKNAAKTDKV